MITESLRHHLGDVSTENLEVKVEVLGLRWSIDSIEERPDAFVIKLKPPPGRCPCGKSTCWMHFMVNGEKE